MTMITIRLTVSSAYSFEKDVAVRALQILVSLTLLISASIDNVRAHDKYLQTPSIDAQYAFQNGLRNEIAELDSRLTELKSILDDASDGDYTGQDLDNDAKSAVQARYERNADCQECKARHFGGGPLGSPRITNSPVSLKIGGFVKADFIHDFDAIGSTDNFDTGTIFTDGCE